MKTIRMLLVLTAAALASPALAGESDKAGAAKATTHSCPAKADRDGKLRCACAAEHETARPAPIFTDAG